MRYASCKVIFVPEIEQNTVQQLAQRFIPPKQVDASLDLATFSLHLGGDSSILGAVNFISSKRHTFPPPFAKRQTYKSLWIVHRAVRMLERCEETCEY
jgi:hypothetical protein